MIVAIKYGTTLRNVARITTIRIFVFDEMKRLLDRAARTLKQAFESFLLLLLLLLFCFFYNIYSGLSIYGK